MTLFRLFIGAMFAVIAIYTLAVVVEHGLNLFPVFFGAMGWPGQFNLDFLGMLMLSALWAAWCKPKET